MAKKMKMAKIPKSITTFESGNMAFTLHMNSLLFFSEIYRGHFAISTSELSDFKLKLSTGMCKK